MSSPTPSLLASPTSSRSPTPIPPPVAAPSPPPTARPVTFTGLPAGSYITHLHSACSGAQRFHIAVLQTLVVRGGTGTIEVAAGDFGRGLCVIVYASRSLTMVLATREI